MEKRLLSEIQKKGVQLVGLRCSILIHRIDCRGLEFGRSGCGLDPKFMDSAVERGRVAGRAPDGQAHR